jgi:FkbM family methyltransferase
MSRTTLDPAVVLASVESPRIVIVGAWNDIRATVPPGDVMHLLEDRPDHQIWCIEPQPWCCTNLRRARFDAGAEDRVRVFECAVGDEDRPGRFWQHAQVDQCSSLRKMTVLGEPVAPGHMVAIEVPIRRLDSLMDTGELPPGADYLTLDVQGCAREAIAGGRRFISLCRMVWAEVEFSEIYQGQALYPEVRATLEALGFEMVTEFGPEDFDGRGWDDALFVRR